MPKPIDFRSLRRSLRPGDVLRRLGHRPAATCRGEERWRCPFHQSTSPRGRTLSTNASVGICYKCGWRGDAVAVWAWHTGMPVYEAALDLCREYGMGVPYLLF